MAHKRSSSRMHAAGSAGTNEAGPLGTQLLASSSFVLPSYSTPDMNIPSMSTSSTNFTFSHSNSLPSLSDMASSSSRSSTSLSSSSPSSLSTSSFSSFSSSISANAIYQIAQDVSQKLDAIHPWKKTRTGSRRGSNTGLLTSTTDRDRPGSTLANLARALHPGELASFIRRSLPESTWDRLVLVIFLVYLTVLLRAMAGYGGSPLSECSHFTTGTVVSNSTQIQQPPSIAIHSQKGDDANFTTRLPLPSTTGTDMNKTAVRDPPHPLLVGDVLDPTIPTETSPGGGKQETGSQTFHCSCNCPSDAPPADYANLE